MIKAKPLPLTCSIRGFQDYRITSSEEFSVTSLISKKLKNKKAR
jgi:hypothetical protein